MKGEIMSQYFIFIILFILFAIGSIISALKYNGKITVFDMIVAAFSASISFLLIFFTVFAVTWSKDYLNEVGATIDDKQIIDVVIDDRLFKDKISITYKDSDDNEIVFDTELPWYLDITTTTSDELWISIDSSNGEFTVHAPANHKNDKYESDNKHLYVSKTKTP